MGLDQAALLEVLDVLNAADAGERVRAAAETMCQALIETELSATIGAGPWEHTVSRTNQRNGCRPRILSTTAGDLRLRIPKFRTGPFFPALLDRRRRVDQALFAVVMEAYLHGVSIRKVDDLVQALGVASGIFKNEVSRRMLDHRHRPTTAGRPARTPDAAPGPEWRVTAEAPDLACCYPRAVRSKWSS
jgi:putative transposase